MTLAEEGLAVHRYGERAFLVDCANSDHALGWLAAIEAYDTIGALHSRPGASTVLVEFDPAMTDAGELEQVLGQLRPLAYEQDPAASVINVPVVYDGDDLADVASITGLSVEEVIAAHSQGTYKAAFVGFSPGFAYLRGLNPRLVVSRLASPRQQVPPGAVGIADRWTGIYPRSSPGGWRLLGHTSLMIWDERLSTPALLQPGTVVRFVDASSDTADA